jgi:hypothetical protein
MWGKCYRDVHLLDFIWQAGWRDSENKADFIISPGDNTQMLCEMIEYLYAHYLDASRHAAREHASAVAAGEEPKPYNAEYVDEYMLKRARECKFAAIVLSELRVLQVRTLARSLYTRASPLMLLVVRAPPPLLFVVAGFADMGT